MLKNDVEYVLYDNKGSVRGRFETKGLLHQFLQNNWPTFGKSDNIKDNKEHINNPMLPTYFDIARVIIK